ncbi:hypothetical protein L6452_03662 [Arctium lappa]|uniref:Uncharacterized protein n=1 Tax=Arctium lappa TaxID=4217 RepID=A0ACB9FNC9_ARCLA|nr:hypothetical protein L6452_03662 [Arctium lappa]
MEQLKHEHQLDLIDLQPKYPHYEEEYEEEEDDWVMKWDFNCPCNRCGKEINFYHRYYYNCCSHACDYSLHKFCGDLPATLKHTSHYALRKASHRALNHTLTLIQRGVNWLCDICRSKHKRGELSYCCMRCDFDIDVKCAMRDEENPIIYHEMVYHPSHPHPLVIINSKPILCECDACGKRHMGVGKTIKTFKDADHPDLVHLPFPDQTYNILQLRFFNEGLLTTFATNEENLNHISHEHPLCLVRRQTNDVTRPTSSSDNSLVCHNPMKKKEVLCNGCIRPIMTRPFYRCTNEAKGCNFALHEWCTRLPLEVKNHPGHPKHTLVLLQKLSDDFPFVFRCSLCKLRCNGFSYACIECAYRTDVSCAFIPEKITHEAHPNHLLLMGKTRKDAFIYCGACSIFIDSWSFPISFSCTTCEFSLHPACALLFPRTMRHKLDKHHMNLRYLPVENHKSKYFCEICEEEMDPNRWFYHCEVCVQSMHCACIPIIRRYEESILTSKKSIYEFWNIKFGGLYKVKGHQHSLSFGLGIKRDGRCNTCARTFEGEMIFKCLKCKLAVDYYCFCRRWRLEWEVFI